MRLRLPYLMLLCSLFINAQTITEFSTGYTSLEGIAIDSNNNVFVSEHNSGKIFKLDTNGIPTDFFSTRFRANDISYVQESDLDGNLIDLILITEPFTNKILFADDSGNVREFTAEFSSPYGITYFNGSIFYSSENTGKIIKKTLAGPTTEYATGFFTPQGIAFDTNGNLYVADRNDRKLFKITPDGVKTTIASGVANITGVAVSPSNDVYFTMHNTFPEEDKVKKYDGSTGVLSDFVTTNLDQPRTLEIDQLGNMYVTNIGSGKVIKIFDESLLPVTIDPLIVNIPDPNFKTALVNNNAINTNGDEEIQKTEAAAFTGDLRVKDIGIKDLTGIEAFTELNFLDCSKNELTTLDMSSNTKLTGLIATDNQLTSINTTANTKLNKFWFQRNKVLAVDVKNNPLLTELIGSNNELTTIDVNTNNALIFLSLDFNKLDTIDVSTNTNIEYLRLFQNELNEIDVEANAKLKLLDCGQNNLTSVDFSSNINLTELEFSSNRINAIDLTNNTLLEKVSCQSVGLTEFDLSKNVNLKRLLCSSTALMSLDLRNGNNVNITNFKILNARNLTCIYVDDIEYSNTNWDNPNPDLTNFVETEEECNTILSVDSLETINFSLYPNPTTNVLNIKTKIDIKKVSIYNLLGTKLIQTTASKINVSALSKGAYIISVEGENNTITSKTFVKK